jgi:hypothetical protein
VYSLTRRSQRRFGRPKNGIRLSIKRIVVSVKVEATPARTHGEAAGWVTLTLSDRFYTPTLRRIKN